MYLVSLKLFRWYSLRLYFYQKMLEEYFPAIANSFFFYQNNIGVSTSVEKVIHAWAVFLFTYTSFFYISQQRNQLQTFALLMKPYTKIQVFILLKPSGTVVANLVPGKFGLFLRNPWQSLAEP